MKRNEWKNILFNLNQMLSKLIKNLFLNELTKFKSKKKNRIKSCECSMSKNDLKECSSPRSIKFHENWQRKHNQLLSSNDLSKTLINELKTEQKRLRSNLKFQQLSIPSGLQSQICHFNPFLKISLNVKKSFWRSNLILSIKDDWKKRNRVRSNLRSI